MKLYRAVNLGNYWSEHYHARQLITGDLQIAISEYARITVPHLLSSYLLDWQDCMSMFFEDIQELGITFHLNLGENGLGLADSPGFESVTLDLTSGKFIHRVWWYPDYQVRDPLDDLLENGEVIFKLAE